MLNGRIDLAVHSAKDMPICLPEGLGILAVSKREDPRDVLVTRKDSPLKPDGMVGTSSLRRRLQLEELYEVRTENLRGNVGTRLAKLKNGEYDGIILAAAGLKRLNLLTDEEFQYEYLSEEIFTPAAGQGIIAVEGRQEEFLLNLLDTWHNIPSMYCLETEREVLRLLDAGCSEPIGVYASIENNEITVRIIYKYEDNTIRVKGTAAIEHRTSLAQDLVQQIRSSYE
jgi:hydroxymethylbilane synthase/uroporphyrinogen III methyltransferase/synthase